VRWLNDGTASTLESVVAWIERGRRSWRAGGTIRSFGVCCTDTGSLVGMVEADLDAAALRLPAGEVNISYVIYPWARGRGYAVRAVDLMCEYLARVPGVDRAVIRVAPANEASRGVALAAGFVQRLPPEELGPGGPLQFVRGIGSAAVPRPADEHTGTGS
jgi:RimJ/RimL family protein N-acetyltransferase